MCMSKTPDLSNAESVERLGRYLVHPPIALGRLQYDGARAGPARTREATPGAIEHLAFKFAVRSSHPGGPSELYSREQHS